MHLMIDPARDADELPELPLPEVVDSRAVVLVGLLSGGPRPLVLDASEVREIDPAAGPMLLSLLRAKRDAGMVARIRGASDALRRRYAGHPLAPYLAEAVPVGDALFVCPDRDDLGFTPSPR